MVATPTQQTGLTWHNTETMMTGIMWATKVSGSYLLSQSEALNNKTCMDEETFGSPRGAIQPPQQHSQIQYVSLFFWELIVKTLQT